MPAYRPQQTGKSVPFRRDAPMRRAARDLGLARGQRIFTGYVGTRIARRRGPVFGWRLVRGLTDKRNRLRVVGRRSRQRDGGATEPRSSPWRASKPPAAPFGVVVPKPIRGVGRQAAARHAWPAKIVISTVRIPAVLSLKRRRSLFRQGQANANAE